MPEIIFSSLAYTDIESLLGCFNESFKNYFVPLHLSKEQLTDKIFAEGIDMKMSFGAFAGNELVGFILNAVDVIDNKTVAYNAGTGVVAAYRGKNLSFSLYEYCIQQLQNIGIKKFTLEVIAENIPAIKTYEKNGFNRTRNLISYKGKPQCDQHSIEIINNRKTDWDLVNQLRMWEPSWQYNNKTIQRAANNYSFLSTANNEAYCIVNQKNGRVAHFGSKEEKYLHALFAWMAENIESHLTIINIDETAALANSFVASTGFEKFITQYEMELKY